MGPVGIRKPQAPFAFRCWATRRKECKNETENPFFEELIKAPTEDFHVEFDKNILCKLEQNI